MRSTIIIGLISITLFSCGNGSQNSKQKQSGQEIGIVVDSSNRTIEQANYQIDIERLYGQWIESKVWVKNQDNSRTGIRSLEVRTGYKFFTSRMFIKEVYEKDSMVYMSRGKFNILDNGNKIRLINNLRNDTVFNDGDTVRYSTKRFHLLNDSILRLEEGPKSPDRGLIIEYQK